MKKRVVFFFENIYKLFIVSVLFFSCQSNEESKPPKILSSKIKKVEAVNFQKNPSGLIYNWLSNFDSKTCLINQIQTPETYKRIKTAEKSFEQWLQFLPLFPKEKKVMLYNGKEKWYQGGQSRVLNIDIGKRDLQQCADAVMRLRAEYLFGKNDFEKIHFKYTNGTNVSFDDWRKGRVPVVNGNKVTFSTGGKKSNSYSNFKDYLIQIFSYAGTASLEKEMQSVPLSEMKIGDVLIQGGHPGHAVLVVDMAENNEGKKLCLLAQSYMPAQNIHILKNPMDSKISPWYEIIPDKKIETPEWDFTPNDLKRFEE